MSKCVGNEEAFWFCMETGPVGFVAHSLEELKKGFRNVPMKSLKFHLRDDKNDFEAWLKNVMGEALMAEKMIKIKEEFIKGYLKGIALRKSLIKSINI